MPQEFSCIEQYKVNMHIRIIMSQCCMQGLCLEIHMIVLVYVYMPELCKITSVGSQVSL